MKNKQDVRYRRSQIVLLILVVFSAFVGVSMILSLFPPMLIENKDFWEGNINRHTQTTYLGILLATYPLGQFIGAPILGKLSDNYGRRKILSLSLIASICSYLLISAALWLKSRYFLLIFCFLAGLSESSFGLARSAIADITSISNRSRYFGYLGVGSSLGFIAGPLIGGGIATYFGYQIPFLIVALLQLFILLGIQHSLQETHQSKKRVKLDYIKYIYELKEELTESPLRILYLTNFLIFFGVLGFWRYLILYMVDRWDMTSFWVTIYYSYNGMWALLANGLILPFLTKKLSDKVIMIVTAIAGICFTLSILISNDSVSLLWTSGPASGNFAILYATCSAYLSNSVSKEQQGDEMGKNVSIQVLATSISAFAGGLIANNIIWLPIVVDVVAICLAVCLLTVMKPIRSAS